MTSEDGYIVVQGWDKFQHYHTGDRAGQTPPWIKAYVALLDNEDYARLSAADRGVLHGIWLLTARVGNGRLSASSVSLRCQLQVRNVRLEPLIQAGFIRVRASKMLAQKQKQSKKRSKPAIEVPEEPKVEAQARGDEPPEPGVEFDLAADRLLKACRVPLAGKERLQLLTLWASGASQGAFESARERVVTRSPAPKNPFGLAVHIIRAESGVVGVGA